MAAFHVYVEGPVDRTPEGIERLAVAISQKYGLPVADLIKRMTAGRFRVKANIDAATADAYARALEEVGARVRVEDATPTQPSLPVVPPQAEPARAPAPPPRAKTPSMPGDKPTRSGRYSVSPPLSSARTAMTPPPGAVAPPPARSKTPSASGPAPRESHASSALMPQRAAASVSPTAELDPFGPPGAGRPSSSSLPPSNAARSGGTSLPPANAPKSNAQFQSGLSAAYSQEVPIPSDLGALGGDALSLSSLDGDDAEAGTPGGFAPSPDLMAASIGPAPEPVSSIRISTPKPGAAKPKEAALDLFAPPDADEAQQQVSLMVDDERPKRMSTPPPPAATNAPARSAAVTSPPLSATPAMRKQTAAQPAPTSMGGGVSAPELHRARFAAGVVISILLGFVPAHLIAASREASAFQKIDAALIATQTAADTPEIYETLDAFRAQQIARKQDERRSIAITSMLIWAVVAAGLGYVWFRRIPWDRFGGS
ncbi:MAG: hypothetical protein JWP01_2364 [Myxococcales bacterium]|nr:hypothetical protein [Myxococcales bacterium]